MNPAKPEYLDLQPIRAVRGTVLLPGSKSITNRMLLLAALAEGRTTLREVLESDDTRYMLAALGQLGGCEVWFLTGSLYLVGEARALLVQ